MDITDFFTQFLEYVLGVLPGDIASNVIALITTMVTICTLVIRFWKEPETTSKLHKLWRIFYVFASFKNQKISGKKGRETNAKETE